MLKSLTPPLLINLVLGIRGGAPASARAMMNMLDALPEGSTWQVIAADRDHLRTTMMAIMLGGNARTGLEDTLFTGEASRQKAMLSLLKEWSAWPVK